MAPGGVVVADQMGPIAGGVINWPVLGVMAENAPLFKPRFLRMARLAQCLETVVDETARAY